MTIFSLWGFTAQTPLHITRLTAEDRGAARRQRLKQTSEKQSVFEFQSFKFRVAYDGVESETKVEKRVLTDRNVSNTTRHVDDAEHQLLPLFNDPERADLPPGNRR